MEAVAAVVRRPWGEQWQTGMGRTLSWRDEAVPMAHLARILGIGGRDAAGEAAGAMFSAVIVEAGEERGALVVDAVEGEHSLLLKPLPPPLLRVRNVAAAALMADGDLMLVLRPADLLRSLQLERTRPAEAAEPLRRAAAIRVLIVDDSVTTRLMEQNLFEAAGYDVRLAADGLEALAVLRDERIDLVVSDVDMPGINGFELTRHIRAEARLADVPVVLVTALESREDKEEGLRAGANAYVTKSDFDQTRLLEIVRRMT
jgi:two-component system chemotaxis sensor kinase CheA